MEVIRQYSDQQNAVIECPTEGITSVMAYAGCGKSTTLVGYAKARPKMRILYLCFNRSVAIEARQTFQAAGAGNVKALTMHSLAYNLFGKPLAAMAENKLVPTVDAALVVEFLGVAGIPDIKKRAVALFALRTISTYCNTPDEGITHDHLPMDNIWNAGLNEEMVLAAARNLFRAMLVEPSCPVGHDIYMKVFQLSSPDLSEYFDLIMVDEGQDLNPVVVSILLEQKVPRIIVGDTHQSIYGFRGSCNALEAEYVTNTLYLNESYRFGASHARLASHLLREFKGVERPLIGLGKFDSNIVPSFELNTIDQHGDGGLEIYRTNGALFQRAVELAVDQKDKETGESVPPIVKSIRYVGGFDSYKFGELVSAYKLYKDDKGYGAFERYNSWSEYVQLSEMTDDANMKSTVSTVERFKGALPVFVHKLKQSEAKGPKAPVTLTNAHKSKGLEANNVLIGSDFPSLLETEDLCTEEINLQYVALTRAKKTLGIPNKMVEDLRIRF